MENLFVIVMPVGSKNQNQYGIVKDSIYQTMLFSDTSAPTSLWLTLQRQSEAVKETIQLFYRVYTMCLSLPVLLFSAFKAFKELITGNKRRVGLLLGNDLTQILCDPLQQTLIFGDDTHVAKYLGIHLYCSHDFYVLNAKVRINSE